MQSWANINLTGESHVSNSDTVRAAEHSADIFVLFSMQLSCVTGSTRTLWILNILHISSACHK